MIMKKGNEPAYPCGTSPTRGLTKREYFAAMAMQGIIAHGTSSDFKTISETSFEIADAMITASEETNE